MYVFEIIQKCWFLHIDVANFAGNFFAYKLQGEEPDEDDAYQVLSTLKRITAFHK